MTFNAMTEHYEEITVCGKPALFTSIRIKRDTVPDGLYAYDVRHDDECRGIPCEIAPFVMVNHWGTIILAEPLELPDDGVVGVSSLSAVSRPSYWGKKRWSCSSG